MNTAIPPKLSINKQEVKSVCRQSLHRKIRICGGISSHLQQFHNDPTKDLPKEKIQKFTFFY